MNIKPGDLVKLNRDHLWAPKGAIGVVYSVFTEWDSDDSICWDLSAFFFKDQLTGSLKDIKWFGKDAGLHADDVKVVSRSGN